jgi:hypothetical protein
MTNWTNIINIHIIYNMDIILNIFLKISAHFAHFERYMIISYVINYGVNYDKINIFILLRSVMPIVSI